MKKIIIIAIVALFANSISAQREETIMNDSGWGLSGAWGGWSFNLGSFDKNLAPYSGGIWAIEFGKKFYIGGLHYNISSQAIGTGRTFNSRSNNLLLGYSINTYKPIHPIFSLATGQSAISTNTEGVENKVWTFHPAAGFEMNVARWCHVDAQLGYRAVTGTKFVSYTDNDFSGFYGQVNLKFGFSWGRYKGSNNDN